MIRANKLCNYMDRVFGEKKPITADVFLTDLCNNKCAYCRYDHGNDARSMTFAEFRENVFWLRRLGVRGVILTGGGEPTCNPDFDKICAWLEKNKYPYGVNTNMNILKLIKPNFLKVSLDTGDRAKYKEIRGVDALNRVSDNLGKYIEWIEEEGAKTKIGVQCVTSSVEQVESFYNAVRGFRVHYIQFRPIEMQGANMDYSAILAKIKELKSHDSRIVVSYKYDLVDYKPTQCFACWSVITLNTRGEVIYCCHRPDEKIGTIFDVDILDKIRRYKPDMSACEIPCRLSGANRYLDGLEVENDIYFV